MYSKLQQQLQYNFSNTSLLAKAFIHSSYYSNKNMPNNERLEFLGDKVLGLCMADILYGLFPNYQEDKLSQMYSYLTSQNSLNNVANYLGLANYLQHNSNINSKILSSSLEALLAVIYLDSNLQQVKQCINTLWQTEITSINADSAYNSFNPKSYLQVWAQQNSLPLPIYTDLQKQGQEHNPTFVVEVTIQGFKPVVGVGSNKKLAQKNAAEKFIQQHIK